MWPGIVGKGPDSEPADRSRHDAESHGGREVSGSGSTASISSCLCLTQTLTRQTINSSNSRTNSHRYSLVAGSLVAPVWPPTGGGSAMGSEDERGHFLGQVRKACAIGQKLRKLGIRKYGVVRIDSAEGPSAWSVDPAENTKRIAETFQGSMHDRRKDTASGSPPRVRSAGAGCTAGSTWSICSRWSNRPKTLGFQADMAHTMLYTLGYNSPESACFRQTTTGLTLRCLPDALRQVQMTFGPLDD